MKTVTSKDGTIIAYDQTGNGPPLVLVDGALNSRAFGLNGPLAALLADRVHLRLARPTLATRPVGSAQRRVVRHDSPRPRAPGNRDATS